MRTWICGAIALLCSALCLADTAEGYWSGFAERDGIKHQIAVRLASRDRELAGTFDWPSMGYLRTDLLGVKVEGRDVRFGVPLPLGSIKLMGIVDGDRIHGTLDPIGLVKGEWQSLGAGGTFELRRGHEPSLPYRTEEVRFANADVTLAGTMFLPSSGNKHPRSSTSPAPATRRAAMAPSLPIALPAPASLPSPTTSAAPGSRAATGTRAGSTSSPTTQSRHCACCKVAATSTSTEQDSCARARAAGSRRLHCVAERRRISSSRNPVPAYRSPRKTWTTTA